MPAEANFGGALADITVTTSYRATTLVPHFHTDFLTGTMVD